MAKPLHDIVIDLSSFVGPAIVREDRPGRREYVRMPSTSTHSVGDSAINLAVIGDTKELAIHGSHLGPYCYPKVIDALATGKVDVKPLLADAYPIAEFDRAMQAWLSGGVLKNLIVQ
jgi:Zn-dependent alcohol dehydrogenase